MRWAELHSPSSRRIAGMVQKHGSAVLKLFLWLADTFPQARSPGASQARGGDGLNCPFCMVLMSPEPTAYLLLPHLPLCSLSSLP